MILPLRAVLFDLDGTLLDTAPDMVGALNALRAEHDLAPLPYDAVRAAVSHGAARVVKIGFPDSDPAAAAALQRRFLDIYRGALSRGTRLFPGMDAVLAARARRGLKSGIVTNKPAWLTEPLLEELNLRARFECVVSGDTVAERKPHPLPLLHAADLIHVAPQACVYVGDAERDIQAGRAAGMRTVVAAYGYIGADDSPASWNATGIVDHPQQLLSWVDRFEARP
jgi:N-acetyl-D-muramate 6-phosphate phosphatase